jgi:hypothetical protein
MTEECDRDDGENRAFPRCSSVTLRIRRRPRLAVRAAAVSLELARIWRGSAAL